MRRPAGRLEADVLAALWAAGRPLTVAEVAASLSADLAHTTVQTILARLQGKGVVEREPHGRTHLYSPVLDRAGIAAQRLRRVLDDAPDVAGVFQQLVPRLSAQERDALVRLLDEHRQAGGTP